MYIRRDAAGRELPRYGNFVYTYSGRVVQPHGPSAESIHLVDIIHHLSNLGRYTGATRRPKWGGLHRKLARLLLNPTGLYSVAQHSVLAAEWFKEHGYSVQLQREGLIHDWHEYMTGDMSSPMKTALHNYKMYEKQFERVLRRKFLGYHQFDPMVKQVDRLLAATEWRDLMPSGADLWIVELPAWDRDIEPWPPWLAKRRLRQKAVELGFERWLLQ